VLRMVPVFNKKNPVDNSVWIPSVFLMAVHVTPLKMLIPVSNPTWQYITGDTHASTAT